MLIAGFSTFSFTAAMLLPDTSILAYTYTARAGVFHWRKKYSHDYTDEPATLAAQLRPRCVL